MVTTREGADITVDETEAWAGLVLEPGQVLEVFMGASSYSVVADVWAAFLIAETLVDIDGSHMVRGYFLGCEDDALAQEMGRDFGREAAGIHLCLGRPCMDTREEARLHVTTVRVWTWETFRTSGYLEKGVVAQAKKWLKGIKKPPEEGPAKLAASAKKQRRKPAMKGANGGDGEKEAPVGSGLTQEMKESLRAKLQDVRKRTHGRDGRGKDAEPTEKKGKPEVVADSSDDETSGYVPTPPGEIEKLGTGTTLPPTAMVALEASERSHGGGGKKRTKGVTKDITSKSLSGQLILRAVEMTKERKKKATKAVKKKSSGEKVARLLSKILTKGSSKKKEKKEKDRRKKRKMVDGVIISCSSSSKSDLESEEVEDDSETDLETPIKKRSRDRPGSVLSLLTEHVRAQMDQASLAEMPGEVHQITGGVKISSYFALHIKPNFHQNLRELREMHSLAATLDLLRTGDIARVGDSLAARFMALHQSMLDQGWGTARFMELHNMDEGGAATPSLVLASRKHSRLVDKVQGKGGPAWSGWYGRGAGRGRGGWKGSGEWNGDGKGGKGKDGKKGKQKGGKGQGQGWERKVNEWKDNKEKPEDK